MIKDFLKYPVVKISLGIIAGIILGVLLVWVWSKLGTRYAILYFGGLFIIALLLCIILLLWRNIRQYQARKMEGALGNAVKNPMFQKEQRQAQVKAALESLKDKWDQALTTLKSTRTDIYDLPWILLIGEPQSGKTTTLRQSGLDFPLGKDALSGTGGTVNCDWWFSNDAIIIDTAGRFTMPVDAAPDREEWHAFLSLLRRHRPRCPISSVIVTIPATSFFEDSPEVIHEKADKIRDKLLELVTILGVDFPTYIMISKSDLIYGFAEFCESLSSVENTQILGWNNDTLERGPFRQSEFDENFDRLANGFRKWGLRRLRDLPFSREADRIYAFPSEFGSIKPVLATYLKRIFRQDRYNTPLFFRGCFFSSGLQQGEAIAGALREYAGENLLNTYKNAFVQSRPYFIYHFYKKVFLENGLVRRVHQKTRREIWLRIGAGVFTALFFLFAVWFLYTGYTSLNRMLNPIKKNVSVAEHLFLSDKSMPDATAGDIISLIDALGASRQALQSSPVSFRFLKGRENAIVRDIGKIEDKLAERCLFNPLMELADSNLDHQASLSVPEKDVLVRLLQMNISALNNRPATELSFDPVVDFLRKKEPAWLDVEKFNIEGVRNSLPRSGDAYTHASSSPRTIVDTRKSLETLNRFWRTYPDKQWIKLKLLLENISNYYNRILLYPSGRRSDDDLAVFIDNSDSLEKYHQELAALLKTDPLISPDALSRACTEDYNTILTHLADNSGFPEAIRLRPTIERHMSVCTENKTTIMGEADTVKFGFLLDKDGHINTEMSLIMDILSTATAVEPLFTETHARLVLKNIDDSSDLVNSRHAEWVKSLEDTKNTINVLLDRIKSNAMKKQALQAAVFQYLDDRLWQADSTAVRTIARNAAGQHLLTASCLERGIAPPLAAQGKWLVSRFEMLNTLKEWLAQQHPSHPDREQVNVELDTGIAQSYAACLRFWKNTLRNYTPTMSVMQATTWKDFRSQVIMHHGILMDTISFPMNMFLENMPFSDLQLLKESVTAADRRNFTLLEREIESITYIYGNSQYASSLADAQKQFLNILEKLPDNAAEAWQTVRNEDEAQGLDGGLKAYKVFSRFKHNIDREGKAGGDRFSNELVNVERHGIRLMNKAFKRSIHLDWQQLVTTWQHLSDTYPFGSKYPSGDVSFQKNTRKTTFETVDASHLHDFFFSMKNGFERFVSQYNLGDKVDSNTPSALDAFINRERFQFLTECRAWRRFLYDKDGNPKMHKVKITLKPGGSPSVRQFTVLRIRGLLSEQEDNLIRLRFSGSSYKEGVGGWHIDLDDVISFTAVNEENHHMSQFVLNSRDLSLPAFLADNGNRMSGSAHTIRKTELKLPDMSVQDENGMTDYEKHHIPVDIEFEWDEKIPGLIHWPEQKNEVVQH